MSSHSDEHIICPNCGSDAHGNYCSQCGQETHLHKDTFWGLVMHFIGHYFHYDSKFWKTLRALLTSPGKLTQAYIDKQRMRYIPPISLYIFISAVYFLIAYNLKDGRIFPIKQANQSYLREIAKKLDSLDDANSKDTAGKTKTKKNHVKWTVDTTGGTAKLVTVLKEGDTLHLDKDSKNTDTSFDAVNRFVESKARKIEKEHKTKTDEYIKEKLDHNFPKIFFCMIPAMAFFLKILYLKRKSITFVHHTVFAIHYHSFWFSLYLLTKIGISNAISSTCKLVFFAGAFIYMVAALKNVYKSSTRRSVVYAMLIAMGYGITFGLMALIFMGIFFAMA